MNVCKVKYICLSDIPGLTRIMPRDFERKTCYVHHASFEGLHNEVFSHCPPGFQCIEPIALRHEVLWSKSLTHKGGMVVRDELHHALEEGEYGSLDWKKKEVTLCVDIERQ